MCITVVTHTWIPSPPAHRWHVTIKHRVVVGGTTTSATLSMLCLITAWVVSHDTKHAPPCQPDYDNLIHCITTGASASSMSSTIGIQEGDGSLASNDLLEQKDQPWTAMEVRRP
jgi:hypothetical protein